MSQKKHGNDARVDPKKHIESLYQSNTVTLVERYKDEVPLSSEENVKSAKKFVDENHK